MGCDNSITSSKHYEHLSRDERVRIESGIKHGDSSYAIAKELGRSQSTIDREIAKASVPQERNGVISSVYFADVGQARHEEARIRSRREPKIEQCTDFLAEIDRLIA